MKVGNLGPPAANPARSEGVVVAPGACYGEERPREHAPQEAPAMTTLRTIDLTTRVTSAALEADRARDDARIRSQFSLLSARSTARQGCLL